jgi:hypothetical protein
MELHHCIPLTLIKMDSPRVKWESESEMLHFPWLEEGEETTRFRIGVNLGGWNCVCKFSSKTWRIHYLIISILLLSLNEHIQCNRETLRNRFFFLTKLSTASSFSSELSSQFWLFFSNFLLFIYIKFKLLQYNGIDCRL